MSDYAQAAIEADDEVPAIHITRDFAATPAQLVRAHVDPDLFARWCGPASRAVDIDYWDARDGGSWRYGAPGEGQRTEWFHGCFHTVRDDRLVQTWTWEGMPDEVALQTMTFTDLGGGRTRLHAVSLAGSFASRDQALASGMEIGIHEGYAALDRLIAEGRLS